MRLKPLHEKPKKQLKRREKPLNAKRRKCKKLLKKLHRRPRTHIGKPIIKFPNKRKEPRSRLKSGRFKQRERKASLLQKQQGKRLRPMPSRNALAEYTPISTPTRRRMQVKNPQKQWSAPKNERKRQAKRQLPPQRKQTVKWRRIHLKAPPAWAMHSQKSEK